MTPYLSAGVNEILVRVSHQAPNSRWYSGAGIYRDVWLKVQHLTHLVSDGSYITIKESENGRWHLEARTEVSVCRKDLKDAGSGALTVEYELWDMQTGEQKRLGGRKMLEAELTRTEPKQTELKQTELKQAEVTQTELAQTELKQERFMQLETTQNEGSWQDILSPKKSFVEKGWFLC